MTGRVSSPRIIGRADELAVLDGALARAIRGEPTAVFLGGDSGIGKSRILREFERRAAAADTRVLVGDCVDVGEGELPFAPIAAALRPLPRELGEDELVAAVGPARDELSVLIPELRGERRQDCGAGDVAQARLFELLLGLIGRLAAERPLAFVIEDLHWADGSTRHLLAFLIRNLRDERVALVASYRTDELHRRHPLRPFLASLDGSRIVERHELRAFTREEVADQLEGILGEPPDAALADRMFERAEGNPLYVEELLAASAEGCVELPSSLQDAFMVRVERLSEPAQQVLRIASAVGRDVDQRLLEAVVELPPDELEVALREAVASQLLVTRPEDGGVAFRHALLREAVHADLLPGEHRRLHLAVADALSRIGGDEPDVALVSELAHHWYAAHEVRRALPAALDAAEAAERLYAYHEAQMQYERALELWDVAPDVAAALPLDRAELFGRAARAAESNGFHPRAVALAQAALEQLNSDAEPRRAATLRERLGRYLWLNGQGEAALAAHRTAVETLPADPPTEERARALAGEGAALMLNGRFSASRGRCEEAIEAARAVGADWPLAQAMNTLGVDLVNLGLVNEGLAALEESRTVALRTGAIDAISRGYCNYADTLALAGDTRRALELGEAGVSLFRELGLQRSSFTTWVELDIAYLLYLTGDLDAAERRLEAYRGRDLSGTAAVHLHHLSGELAFARGDVETAREMLAVATPLAERAMEVQWTAPIRTLEADIALAEGRVDDARTAIRAGIEMAEPSEDTLRKMRLYAAGVAVEAAAAERARALGDEEASLAAESAGHALLESARALARGPLLAPAVASLALAEAEASRLGGGDPDPDAWTPVREHGEKLERPFAVAYARFREAEAAVALRDRERAAAALDEARAIAVRTGAARFEAEVQGLARRARLDTAATEEPSGTERGPADDLGLTPREMEVLLLVAEGRTNRQIAETLFMSEKTASVHVSRILAKLDVRSRTEAAAAAYRLGLTAATT